MPLDHLPDPDDAPSIRRALDAGTPAAPDAQEMLRRFWDANATDASTQTFVQRWNLSNSLIAKRRTSLIAALGLCAVIAIVWIVGSVRPTSAHTPYATYTTPAGVTTRVTLSDGSRVTIAPGSNLRINEFSIRVRTLELQGEAYFEVTDAKATPFVVRTGSVSTKVLGTAFSVRRYASDDTTHVAVVSGKVGTSGRGAPITIVAGTSAWATDSVTGTVTNGNARTYTDWQRGRLVFRDAPVPEMLASVGRWYGYAFTLRDSVLTTRNVSVTLKMSDRADMIAALKELLDVSMTFNGTTVTLTPRRASVREKGKKQDVFTPSREMGR